MPARILPADSELAAMAAQGLTHQQIADEVERRTGRRVSRSAVSVALMRAGETDPRPRYLDTVPWTVAVKHSTEYPVRMLRALGRQRAGLPLRQLESRRLATWLHETLEDGGLIVAYCPAAPDGEHAFVYIPSDAKDHDDDVPIRREPVLPRQIGY